MTEFTEFPKIARLTRPCIITEKIDGTNASVFIGEDGAFLTGSRTRWITPAEDNHGFARWAEEHREELLTLGPGHHYGEWWGRGVNKRYPMIEPKRFSLFNVSRWRDIRPACCDVVPVLYEGIFSTEHVNEALVRLALHGSVAAPGCDRPEGVVIFHVQGRLLFKKTLEKDEEPKGLATPAPPTVGRRGFCWVRA